ncbi:hypothetical protein ASA1KI_43050 [Opitutales bacterium ASA1]|uniref:glycosyltransferase n=1 Tax=Congregicoccus parvus TaxID=3081749 RepID=UPI002B2E5BB6|nr:hypothetical protein ASA1KI_43050 [Opitutales bacterium ASA1]
MKIVFLSHSGFDDVFVVGSHELARAFARMDAGIEVLHVSMPVSLVHFAFGAAPAMRRRLGRALRGPVALERGLTEWVPVGVLPYKWTQRWPRSSRRLVGPSPSAIARHARRFVGADVVFVDEPRMFGAVAALRPKRIVYRPTDVYPKWRDEPGLVAWEREMVRLADVCVATSGPVARHLADVYGVREVHVVENGVSIPVGAERERVSTKRRHERRMVYVGAIDHRFDADAVDALGERRRDWRIDVFGPGRTRGSGRVANVRYAGGLPARARWEELFASDVGLLPMNGHPSNQGRSPMKIYEYLAAGLPVLARRTEELARRAVPGVFLYDEGGQDEALERLLHSGWRGDRASLREFAEAHGWDRKAVELASAAGLELHRAICW